MQTMQESTWDGQDGRYNVQKNVNARSTGSEFVSRRRNPLACETCYKRKIRCEVEGDNSACVQCMRRDIRCRFTTRKEKRENIKRSQYVRSLEERLKRTESLLRAAGVLDEEMMSQDETFDDEVDESEEDDDDAGLQENVNGDYLTGTDRSWRRGRPAASKSKRNSCASLDSTASKLSNRKDSLPGDSDLQQVPVLRCNDKEDSRYYGRSSFLSILSREGIEWIKNKTGDVRFLSLFYSNSSHDSPWDYWRPDVFHDIFASEVFKPLPPRAEVFTLLRDYFRTVNRLFPVYHEESFMQLIEWQYTQQTCNDAARWASLNIILSLAYEYRFSNSLKPEKDREKAWLYFKNAMSVFTELTLRRTDLLSVQALLGMALFLRGNSGTQSALPVVTAAIRSCHRMGLHRNIPRPYLSPVEREQRKRVFWIAYVLDQSICIRAGNAPAQHPDDFDVDFPAEGADDGFPAGHESSFFRQLCRLTVIKSRIYGRLYSAKALHNKSPTQVIGVVEELHTELENWKSTNPFDSHVKQKAAGEDFLLGFAAVGLQFVYYNSLIMIHRMPLIVSFAYAAHIAAGAESHFDPRILSKQSSVSAGFCVQAARDTLRLVNNMPWGDIAWIWSLLYYVFLAVMTIFVNILRDSKHPNVKEDLQSLNMAATFFTTLIPGGGPCNYATFMMKMCANFERIARMVLERDEKSISRYGSESHTPNERARRTLPKRGNKAADSPTLNRHAPAAHSRPSNIEIPDLEGLPHINSSGYFVPESPNSDENSTTHPITNPQTAPPTSTTIPNTNPTRPIPNYTSQPQPPYTTTTTVPPSASTFPYTTTPTSTTTTTPQNNLQTPDFWQIPLTADWELGGQFLSGIFTHGFMGPESFASNAGPGSGSVPDPMQMFGLGQGFDNQAQNQVHNQEGSEMDGSSMWTGVFLDSY